MKNENQEENPKMGKSKEEWFNVIAMILDLTSA
jgi:hypothetical protein